MHQSMLAGTCIINRSTTFSSANSSSVLFGSWHCMLGNSWGNTAWHTRLHTPAKPAHARAHRYRMRLIMPKTLSAERAASMLAYGAELVLIDGGMEDARDMAKRMWGNGEGIVLDQVGHMIWASCEES